MSVALFFFGLTSVYTMPKPWVRNARYAYLSEGSFLQCRLSV